MKEETDLLLFQHLISKNDCDLGLETAALVVAEAEYPGLNLARYAAKLDRMGRRARKLVQDSMLEGAPPIVAVLRMLYEDMGFRGNVSDYYDPKNSFLNDVLDRRLGIPISLALVIMSVSRRAGVRADGVSFPGHFLVRTEDDHGNLFFVDPFDGRLLDEESLQLLYEQTTGDPADLDPAVLQPACRRQILARLLNNLRAIYEVRGDRTRLRRVLQRMAILNPSDDIESRLALLGKNAPLTPRLSVN
ncbi:MAG: transglutaminase-like domain-containing protein [Myxococcales bacterium]|nr:transglutaminase-like domain-containing protein [Myxococcales bacterium]